MKRDSKMKKTFKKMGKYALVLATSFNLSCGGVESNSTEKEPIISKPYSWEEMMIEDKNINYDSLTFDEKNLTDELNLVCNNTPITEEVSKKMEEIVNIMKFLHSNNLEEVKLNDKFLKLNNFLIYDKYYISLDYSSKYDSMYFMKRFNDITSIRYKYSVFIGTNTLRGYSWILHSVFDNDFLDNFVYDNDKSKEDFDKSTHYIYLCKKYFDPVDVKKRNFSELVVIPRNEMEKITQKLGLTNEEVYEMSNYDMK
jgi:hypothetical protein